VNVRFRNTFEKRFEGKVTVQKICTYACVLGDAGWNLDVSAHSDGISIDTDGISIDTDGITIHFVKTSDKKETITAEQEFLFNADVALDMMRQDKAERRRAQS
jgi:hypothetical protein